MKKIFRYFLFVMLLSAGVVATSCSDDPDAAMDTIPYDRVLTPLNFEAEVVASVGTDILFSWSKMDNADGYILQLFEAVGEEGEAPIYDQATPIKEYDVASDNVPFVATDLEVDKTFWARVKAYSDLIGDSKWAELTESVSTSAVRDGLNPAVVSRTTSEITLKWDAADDKEDLTSIRVEKVQPAEGDSPVLYTLTAEDIAAASATVGNLTACTNYKFTLLFGKSGKRGIVTAWTRPSTEGLNRVNTAEGLYSAINGATGDVKLVLEYTEAGYDMQSQLLDLGAGISVGCNLTLIGETSEEGKKPVVNHLQFTLAEGCTSIRLEDLYFDSNNKCGTLIQNDKATLTAMEVVNCEICNYQKAIYSVASSGTSSAQKILFSGDYVHDVNPTGSAGGDFIDLRAGMTNEVEIVNSTFYACARTFFRASDNAKLGKATIKNCTFNYVTSTLTSSNNAGIFHVRQTTEATGLFMTKNVFLNQYNDNEPADGGWVRIARNSTDSYAPLCDGNIYYNVGPAWWTSGAYFVGTETPFSEADAMVNGILLENDPCVNSAAGKLYLIDNVIASNQAGDPRWWDATEPVVIRATELELVTEPRIWDFTEKTIFQTETVEGATIIDNIKIYGPAEIVMTEGLTFTEAGVMDKAPQSGALHFKAEGYGAVVVSTADAGYNGSIQVISGEDRYTIQADGEPHKVLFGDATGENDYYVLAGSPVTVLSVEWTQDLTPDATQELLMTPVVLFDATSVEEGTEQAVTASWSAVENAASYEVTFQGVTLSQSETTFVLDAAVVATLPVGEHTLSVVAKPVETSSKYAASEPGETTLKIKELPKGGVVTWKWNFSEIFTGKVDPLVSTDEKSIYLLNSDGSKIDVGAANATAGESLYLAGNGKKIKVNSYTNTADGLTYNAVNYGGGDAFMFINVPQDGTLKVTAAYGKADGESDCQLGVYQGGPHKDLAGYTAGTLVGDKIALTGYKKDVAGNGAVEYEFAITGVTGSTMVAITKPGGATSPDIYAIEFTYETAAVSETLWDFATIFTGKVDPLVSADEKSIYMLNSDGSKVDVGAANATATETIYLAGNGKKIKVNSYANTADGLTYNAVNYGGGDAFMFINVDKNGTLKVKAAYGKADGESDCQLAVYQGGPHKDLAGYTKGELVGDKIALTGYKTDVAGNGAVEYEFEITGVTGTTMLAITKPGGATSPDIYSIAWAPAN